MVYLRYLAKKLRQNTQFQTGRCFTNPPLISATQKLIISLQRIKFYMAEICEHSVLLNLVKNSLLMVITVLYRWSVKTLRPRKPQR